MSASPPASVNLPATVTHPHQSLRSGLQVSWAVSSLPRPRYWLPELRAGEARLVLQPWLRARALLGMDGHSSRASLVELAFLRSPSPVCAVHSFTLHCWRTCLALKRKVLSSLPSTCLCSDILINYAPFLYELSVLVFLFRDSSLAPKSLSFPHFIPLYYLEMHNKDDNQTPELSEVQSRALR